MTHYFHYLKETGSVLGTQVCAYEYIIFAVVSFAFEV